MAYASNESLKEAGFVTLDVVSAVEKSDLEGIECLEHLSSLEADLLAYGGQSERLESGTCFGRPQPSVVARCSDEEWSGFDKNELVDLISHLSRQLPKR